MNENENKKQKEATVPEEIDEEIINEHVDEFFETDDDTGEAAESSHSEQWPENLYEAIFGAIEAGGPKLDDRAEDVLLGALQNLTPREEIVVRMYYKDKMSIENIAKEFGVVRARIDEILRTAIRKLRSPMVADKIRKLFCK